MLSSAVRAPRSRTGEKASRADRVLLGGSPHLRSVHGLAGPDEGPHLTDWPHWRPVASSLGLL